MTPRTGAREPRGHIPGCRRLRQCRDWVAYVTVDCDSWPSRNYLGVRYPLPVGQPCSRGVSTPTRRTGRRL